MARKLIKRTSKGTQGDLGLQTTCTALYVRVSTQLQADEGFSLEAQQERLEAHCKAQGWAVDADHIYIDAGVSGKTTDRPKFTAMLAAAQAGQVQRIVAMKLDRMARNVREFLTTVDQLKAWGCDLVLVKESFDTSTPHGRFALTMFAAMAELEASTITERVMTGKAQKATQGGYNGSRCPLGYDYQSGAFIINDQAQTVRSVFALFLQGLSINAIAQKMNDEGRPTARAGKADKNKKQTSRWYASTVRTILGNGIYAGVGQWAGVEVAGSHPAIIDPATYEQAHRRLQSLRPGKQLESEIERRLEHLAA